MFRIKLDYICAKNRKGKEREQRRNDGEGEKMRIRLLHVVRISDTTKLIVIVKKQWSFYHNRFVEISMHDSNVQSVHDSLNPLNIRLINENQNNIKKNISPLITHFSFNKRKY